MIYLTAALCIGTLSLTWSQSAEWQTVADNHAATIKGTFTPIDVGPIIVDDEPQSGKCRGYAVKGLVPVCNHRVGTKVCKGKDTGPTPCAATSNSCDTKCGWKEPTYSNPGNKFYRKWKLTICPPQAERYCKAKSNKTKDCYCENHASNLKNCKGKLKDPKDPNSWDKKYKEFSSCKKTGGTGGTGGGVGPIDVDHPL